MKDKMGKFSILGNLRPLRIAMTRFLIFVRPIAEWLLFQRQLSYKWVSNALVSLRMKAKRP